MNGSIFSYVVRSSEILTKFLRLFRDRSGFLSWWVSTLIIFEYKESRVFPEKRESPENFSLSKDVVGAGVQEITSGSRFKGCTTGKGGPRPMILDR